MRFRRVPGLAAVAVSLLLWAACGDYYRPVVIPISTTPPNPSNFHAIFSVNSNGAFAAPSSTTTPTFTYGVGSAMQIDVAGDTIIGATGGLGSSLGHLNINPTHAALLPNNTRVFVASAGSVANGGADVISAFAPVPQSSIASGLGNVSTFPLPNVVSNTQSSSITSITESGNTVTAMLASALTGISAGGVIVISGVFIPEYDGTFTITNVSGNSVQYTDPTANLQASSGGTASVSVSGLCRYLPAFVSAAENTAVYVANYGEENTANPACTLPNGLTGTDSIAVLNPNTDIVSNLVYLPGGSHPVALVQAVNGNTNKLYSANVGNNTISSFNTVDMSTNAVTGFTGTIPVWMEARADGQKVFVVTQGDGNLVTIDTASDTVSSTLPVGAGANYVAYDPNLGRLYVTNPATSSLYIFSATGGLDSVTQQLDDPTLLTTINLGAAGLTGNYPSCASPCPVSVSALPDGSRAYVASYTLSPSPSAACADPTYSIPASLNCSVSAAVTVIDTPANTIKSTIPLMSSGSQAVPESADCVPAIDGNGNLTYTPMVPGAPTPRFTTRFRLSTAAAADSSHVYVGFCDAGAVADIITTTSTIAVGANQPDRLVTDLDAPFGVCGQKCNVPEPFQNPVFLLSGR